MNQPSTTQQYEEKSVSAKRKKVPSNHVNNMFRVENIMETEVITVRKDTPVYEAIELLSENYITGLPVVNDDMTIAGIITEKDVLTLLYANVPGESKVEDFMSKDVVSFDISESMIDVTDCFIKHHFRRVPIVADGKLVGIVSKKDIIAYILEMRKIGEMELTLQSIHRERRW